MPPFPWIICRIPSLKTSSNNLHKFPIFRSISLVYFPTSTPKISIFDYLVYQHNFSPECASKVSSLSSTKYLNKPRNADSILNFLNEVGFSKNQIQTLVQKAPWILSSNLETSVKPKMKIFQDLLCFHSTDLADIVSAAPLLLRISTDRIRLSILGLKNVLGPNVDICRLLKKFGGVKLFKYDLERTLVPNIEYLKSCGICSLQIASYICRSPKLFVNKTEILEGFVERVDEMGVDRKAKMFLEAVRVISSMSKENWELKLQVFRELGFSENDILLAFRRMPQAFGASKRKIKEVTELLLSVEDFSISDIVNNPSLLGYNVEKRLNPRVQVFKALVSKNLLKKRPGLAGFCKMTDAKFTKKYLIPYSDEIGDLCVVRQGSSSTDSGEKFLM